MNCKSLKPDRRFDNDSNITVSTVQSVPSTPMTSYATTKTRSSVWNSLVSKQVPAPKKKDLLFMSPRFMTFLRCKITECGLRKEPRSTVPDTTCGQLYSAPFPLTCLEYWVHFQRFFTFRWWQRALNLFGETHKTKSLSSNLYLNKNNSLIFQQLFLLHGHSDWCYAAQQQELTITG